jgi:hypothetical protein
MRKIWIAPSTVEALPLLVLRGQDHEGSTSCPTLMSPRWPAPVRQRIQAVRFQDCRLFESPLFMASDGCFRRRQDGTAKRTWLLYAYFVSIV